MGTEGERHDTRKAMAYDLIKALERNPEKETYTVAEIKRLIDQYVETACQK
jgi:hypothetical protein